MEDKKQFIKLFIMVGAISTMMDEFDMEFNFEKHDVDPLEMMDSTVNAISIASKEFKDKDTEMIEELYASYIKEFIELSNTIREGAKNGQN